MSPHILLNFEIAIAISIFRKTEKQRETEGNKGKRFERISIGTVLRARRVEVSCQNVLGDARGGRIGPMVEGKKGGAGRSSENTIIFLVARRSRWTNEKHTL